MTSFTLRFATTDCAVDIAWKQVHDRVSLSYHTVPQGYFSLFKELRTSSLADSEGANLVPTVPADISVGHLFKVLDI